MSDLSYIQKGPKTVNGQYRFASHDQVTAAVHPFLVKHGIVVISTLETMTQEGNRTQAMMLSTFVNVDEPSDQFTVRFPGYGVDSGDKGPGKAMSYALKYAFLKVLCLETGDDPDMDANAHYEPPKCLEFDLLVAELTDKELVKLNKFLAHSSLLFQKHIEDVKREAVTRMPEFLKALKQWNPKKQDE